MEGGWGVTHIRVSPDLLNGLVIEVAGVAQEASDDVVGVLETLEDVGGQRELGALPQLHAVLLVLCVDVLDPTMVVVDICSLDVLLEDDHVRVGDLFGVDGGEDGGGILVDGVDGDGGR